MPNIIEENRKPSFGQKFAGGINKGLQFLQSEQTINAQNEALKKADFADLIGLPPELQKIGFEQRLKDQRPNKEQQEKKEKFTELQGAMDRLNQMIALRKKGNLGKGIPFLNASGSPFPETRRDAGSYAQLGKSLIQYATTIPIRNKIEFETLADDLYDPDISDAYAEGVLNRMIEIIQDSMDVYSDKKPEKTGGQVNSVGKPVEASSFWKKK